MTAKPHHAGRGTLKAAAYASRRVEKALTEFRSLNSREARAAFADHWIGLWARDFDDAWPMVYELLEIVKNDELFRDPRRVGPGAAGDEHSESSGYSDFSEYFEDRVRRPFDTWLSLERDYQFVQQYRPELITETFDTVTRIRQEEERDREQQRSHGGDRHSEDFKYNNVKVETPVGNARATALRKLRAEAENDPDVAELRNQVLSGGLSPHAAMVKAGFRPRTFTVRADPASAARTLRRHMSPNDLATLARLLTEEDA